MRARIYGFPWLCEVAFSSRNVGLPLVPPIPVHIEAYALGLGGDDLAVLVPVTVVLPGVVVPIWVGYRDDVEIEHIEEVGE